MSRAVERAAALTGAVERPATLSGAVERRAVEEYAAVSRAVDRPETPTVLPRTADEPASAFSVASTKAPSPGKVPSPFAGDEEVRAVSL